MLLFAIFTLGYFAGVFTTLAIFPPNVREIEEQEKDALQPILDVAREGEMEEEPATEYPIFDHPVAVSS